jgi:hypothetical protein
MILLRNDFISIDIFVIFVFMFNSFDIASEQLVFVVSDDLVSVNVLGVLLFINKLALQSALFKLGAAPVESGVEPSEEFTLGRALSNDKASSEGLTVAVLASNQASVLFASALGSSREFDGQGEVLVLGLGLALGSRNVLDGSDGYKVLARPVCRHFALVGSGTVSIDLEKCHRDASVCTDCRDALGDGLLELCSLVDRGLLLAIELLRATGRVIALYVTRSLVEEPKVLARKIRDAEADTFHAVGTLDFGDDTMGVDRSDEEEGSEEASIEEHVVI